MSLEIYNKTKYLIRRKKHHIIISGYGRSGTTFLMHFLTALGQDTGFKLSGISENIDPVSHGGLEKDIHSLRAPYFVKDPYLCESFDLVMANNKIVVDALWIPVRDSTHAAKSRNRVSEIDPNADGGVWLNKDKNNQELSLLRNLNSLLVSSSKTNIPIVVLNFPLIIKNVEYLFNKINPFLNIEFNNFKEVHSKIANEKLINF